MPSTPLCRVCGGLNADWVSSICNTCPPRMEAALREIAERGCYTDRQIAKKALGLLPEPDRRSGGDTADSAKHSVIPQI